MQLSFLNPFAGYLLLLLPLLWWLPRGRGDPIHFAIRSLIFALLILALMRPVLLTNMAREHHAIILDQSPSLTLADRQEAVEVTKQLLQDLEASDQVSLIQLGGGSRVDLGHPTLWIAGMSNDASPLGDALELAARTVPNGEQGSVTLISDGLATNRHWSQAIGELLEREIPVHTYQIVGGAQDPALISLDFPRVRPDESVRARALVQGRGQGLVLTLRRENEEIARSSVFDCEGQCLAHAQFEAPMPGFYEITAELMAPSGDDPNIDNNTRSQILIVDDPVQVLYVDGRQVGASELLQEVLGAGFEVQSIIPETLAQTPLADYALVMLDDLPARVLDEASEQTIVHAVQQDGIGLFVSGGEAAFGDGGYATRDIAELFPVEIEGDEDVSDPSVGLALIVDTSGSMAGTRIELAKQIARIAVRRMQPHDRIGIVEFYGAKHWAVPMQSASNKIEIDRAIGRMKAIGGTVLYPAIQEAYYGLMNVNTRYKHVVVITDAGVEESNYEGMVRRIHQDNIHVSTILVGQGGHNLIMSDIANWGQGRFYSVANQFNLVELIFKRPSTKKPSRYRRGEFALQALGGSSWWSDIDKSGLMPLAGYVEVKPRDGAEILVKLEGEPHPIVSTWRHGLGRVTTLLSEPLGFGTSSWLEWPDYAEFLARLAARTAADQAPFSLEMKRRHDTVTLSAKRLDRDASLVPEVRLVDPRGQAPSGGQSLDEREVILNQTAPDLFEAEIRTSPDESLFAILEIPDRASVQRIANVASSDISGETQVDRHQALDLRALSQLTGGDYLSEIDWDAWELEAGAGDLAMVVTRLWPYLLLLALLLFLADIIYRRWPS